jgi:hypothetical protein
MSKSFQRTRRVTPCGGFLLTKMEKESDNICFSIGKMKRGYAVVQANSFLI